ncbi:MAG: hypothetical protein NC349_06815 [Paenibacillus sp.]|nr:hypothetical protein [Paenibacillus sp.]
MKYPVHIFTLAVLFLLLLPSCHDDEDYAEAGTSWVYENSGSEAIEDGTYLIRNTTEYKALMSAPLPAGCNIDFNKNSLVIAKGHDVNGYDDIKVSGSVEGNAYIINVTLVRGTIIRPAVASWCTATVMPKKSDPSIKLNITTSAPE